MKAILFLSILSADLLASDFTKQIWSHHNDHYLMNVHTASQIMISENCFSDEVALLKSKCDAARALSAPKSLSINSNEFIGGKNPGAVVCSQGLKMKVLVLKDSKDNENSFCVFNDQSMISAINLQSLLKD